MAQRHKSAVKAARQSLKRRQRNRAVLSTIKGVLKKVETAVEQKDAAAASAALRDADSTLRKAVTKGVMNRNTASRRISGFAHRINSIGSSRS